MLDRNIVSGMPPEKIGHIEDPLDGEPYFGPHQHYFGCWQASPADPAGAGYWFLVDGRVFCLGLLVSFSVHVHASARVGIEWVGWVESGQSLAAEE